MGVAGRQIETGQKIVAGQALFEIEPLELANSALQVGTLAQSLL